MQRKQGASTGVNLRIDKKNRGEIMIAICRSTILIVILVTLSLPASAYSQWSANPIVNNAICTATGDQSYPTIVGDGSGGAIITWQDYRGGSSYDIYAQRIGASGVVQWSADGVAICTATVSQSYPTIVSDGSGGAVITWQDNRGGSNYDIYAQRIDASGVVQWSADGVAICTATGDQSNPMVVGDGSGGAIITWQDYRGGSNYDIYAQRIGASGVVQWSADGVAICTATGNQYSPMIVGDGSGGAVITWQDYRGGGSYDIYAQRIGASGVVQWSANGVAICTATGNQSYPTIVSDGSGGAIVTWYDYRGGTTQDIYAQHISASGVAQWSANGVAICTATGDQLSPTIVSDGSGGAIITWYDLRTGNMDIYAQRIGASGVVQWSADGVAICTATGQQYSPTIVSDGSGGAIITWQDNRGGNNYDIYAQRIGASGVVQWSADGVAICTATANQSSPTIVGDGSGGAIITWPDYRGGGSYDIYAQRVDRLGNLYPEPWIAKAGDVANDQGGKIRVMWDPSNLDVWPNITVRSYVVWMGTKTTGVLGKTGSGTTGTVSMSGAGDYISSNGIYWQQAGSVAARWLTGYSLVVATYADSGLQGVPYYYFQVTANAADSVTFWTSNIDSGYSADNIPPDPPISVAARVGSGIVDMTWKKNREPDFWRYAVYRNDSSITDPSGLTPIATTQDTIFTDSHPITDNRSFYVVCAQDIHGNLSTGSNQISVTPSDLSLSVSVTAFTASALEPGVRLDWKTGSETDNAGFIILRNMDGSNSFKEIASYRSCAALKGLGTSAIGKSYSYTDNSTRAEGKYTYELESVTAEGVIHLYNRITVDVSAPTDFALFQNYPNPFNPTTTVGFNLKEASEVTLSIYNILGQVVASWDYGTMGAGRYQENINMDRFTSGVYYYRINAVGNDGQQFVSTKKLVLMK
jgi:Secretion system C-terminal sorting domain